ncbi:hypothetical protein GCM10018952_47960 [Streptosporangium vulgare]
MSATVVALPTGLTTGLDDETWAVAPLLRPVAAKAPATPPPTAIAASARPAPIFCPAVSRPRCGGTVPGPPGPPAPPDPPIPPAPPCASAASRSGTGWISVGCDPVSAPAR